ncbi:unnamed protein product [Orchesella dallaii]|uniref:Gustatory receptor n=1 Tax=Orchesella dallaii TaxID=48710 RepID=A0ABP1PZ85_9HEXA
MNSLRSGQASTSAFETILFPQKIKPYYPEVMAKSKQFHPRKTFHLLELTEPQLLLEKIFQPYLRLVKLLGCQPLKIQDGLATFNYFSWNVAYSLIIFGVFIFDTTFFLPIMKYMNSEQEKNCVVFVTEIILVLSQIFAAQMSYVFMALRAKKLAGFWNRLQAVLLKLVSRCPSHLDLVPSYRSARMKIVVWLMFTFVFGTCYMISFQDEISAYLISQEYNSVYYCVMLGGFAFYSGMLSLHILHSTCFTTFICVMHSCFHTLGNISLRQDGQGVLMNSQSPVLFQEVLEIYNELLDLKCLLGCIYGVYMALEILAMIICTTINIFFMISRPGNGNTSLLLLNLAIVMPYLIWFHGVCDCGGALFKAMKTCHRNIKKGIASATTKVAISERTLYLQIEPPDCMSASGYFLMDKKLFTTVIGTIATYLVVMLQFGTGTGMNCKDGSIQFGSDIQKNSSV